MNYNYSNDLDRITPDVYDQVCKLLESMVEVRAKDNFVYSVDKAYIKYITEFHEGNIHTALTYKGFLDSKARDRQECNFKILNAIANEINKFPDQRFGQILYNMGIIYHQNGEIKDPFFEESYVTLRNLNESLSNNPESASNSAGPSVSSLEF